MLRRVPSARFGRRRDQRGAAAVEFALVVPLLLLIVFGIVDFGIAFSNFENVRSGTREAARLGVVNNLSSAPSCTIDGSTITPPTNPTTVADATNVLVCKTKDRIGLAQSETKVKLQPSRVSRCSRDRGRSRPERAISELPPPDPLEIRPPGRHPFQPTVRP